MKLVTIPPNSDARRSTAPSHVIFRNAPSKVRLHLQQMRTICFRIHSTWTDSYTKSTVHSRVQTLCGFLWGEVDTNRAAAGRPCDTTVIPMR